MKVQEEYINIEEIEKILDLKNIPDLDAPYYLLKMYESIVYNRSVDMHMINPRA